MTGVNSTQSDRWSAWMWIGLVLLLKTCLIAVLLVIMLPLSVSGVGSQSGTTRITAQCPSLIFSGQSHQTQGDLDDIYDYADQEFLYVYVYGYSQDDDTLDATVSGYSPTSGMWETIAQQAGGSGVIVDQSYDPPTYTRLRVQLNDTEDNDLIYYDYEFHVCREPVIDLSPASQEHLAHPGTTTVYSGYVSCLL